MTRGSRVALERPAGVTIGPWGPFALTLAALSVLVVVALCLTLAAGAIWLVSYLLAWPFRRKSQGRSRQIDPIRMLLALRQKRQLSWQPLD